MQPGTSPISSSSSRASGDSRSSSLPLAASSSFEPPSGRAAGLPALPPRFIATVAGISLILSRHGPVYRYGAQGMAQIAIDRPLPSSLNGFVCCTPSLWAWDKCGSVKARGIGFKITVQLAAQRAAFEACVAHCERAPRAAAQCRPRSVGSRRRRRFWCIGRPSEARTLPRFCTPTGCQAQLNSRQHTVCCDMCPDAVWIRVVQVLSLPALGRSRRCPTWRERAHTHSRAVGAPRCRSRFRRQRSAGLAIFSHAGAAQQALHTLSIQPIHTCG